MTRAEILERILSEGVIAVLRMSDARKVVDVARAVKSGGISALEITMTTPNALQVIEESVRELGRDVLIGVGSVLDAETARLAIASGACYVVSPVLKPEIIETAHRHDRPVMPGAFTPTELWRAHELGADIIKVFPADVVGMAFFKGVKAPMPQLQLMPTGGVTLHNAGEWIKAGACAVGVGSALLDKKAIAGGNYSVLTENARTLCASVRAGRDAMKGGQS